ncbi:MAG TPA: permease-like cell division protein FtsX [Sandaracinaceae bacterium LLY-WYZ-13_1]|nr:permease-like cell division protein FtsX [Sandaracinaceae bacterium LLY-WYZ-13_1]
MHLKKAITRAARAMREDLRLHLVAISSLTVAFLCLASALWAIANLSSVADAWGRSARMSVYLRDGASAEEVDRLRLLLEGLGEVRAVEHLSSAEAQAEFTRDAELNAELSELPADVFPASLEVELAVGTSADRMTHVAERIGRFGVVEDVETYQGWFDRLESLLTTGRVASTVLAVLVLLCVLFVVGNTIRLAIAGRRDEIEVLKLCGASDGFVRGPFLVEGAVQGLVSAALALVLLFALFVAFRAEVDGTIAALAGVHTVFLHPAVMLGLVLGGAVLGAAGSAISLRRYLVV